MTNIRTKRNKYTSRSKFNAKKIGQTGYSVSQAIAELVDNSIDAGKEDTVLTVEIFFDADNSIVKISDDGIGMDESTAANSIKLAYSTKKINLVNLVLV